MKRRLTGDIADANASWLSSVQPDHVFTGTPGRDHFKGTIIGDTFDMSQGGDDAVKGRGGDDSVYFGAAFTGDDKVNGGKGADTVTLDGDYSAGIDVQANSLTKIERLVLEGGSYVITGELGFKDSEGRTYIDGGILTTEQSLHLSVSSLGRLYVSSGAGDDVLHANANGGESVLIGNSGDDEIIGGAGASVMAGDVGADRIIMSNGDDVAFYGKTLDSTAKFYDTIENFVASGGRIEFDFDSDTSTPGFEFDFHFGKTADRTGDILVKYDAGADETIVKVFTDADHKADFVLHLTGDVPLTAADFIFG